VSVRPAAVLRSVDIFARLAPADIDRFAERMVERTLAPNEVLFRAGEPADCMAVVISGVLELSQSASDGQGRTSQLIGEGEACGDVPLFSGERYGVTATAQTETRVLVLGKPDFEALVASHPPIMRSVLGAISRRVTQVNRQLISDQAGKPDAITNGRIIVVFSPRGGAGKTTLAVNLALQLASTQPGRVALLDLDLLFDDAAFLLDARPVASLASVPEHALAQLGKHAPSSLLAEHASQLRILVAATQPEDGERITAGHVRAVLSALHSQFAITVVDCSSSLGEPTLVALELADKVIMVCTPDLASLRDTRDCQRIFGQAVHVDRQRLLYCFNHPLPVAGLTRPQFESALEQPLAIDVPHAGEPFPLAHSHSAFGRAIVRLASDVSPVPAATAGAAPRHARRLRLWGRG
jgi:Flp pilus assembly CpaE family ATPase